MFYTDVFGMPTREEVARDGGIDVEWPGRSGVCIAYSGDGIHWEPYVRRQEMQWKEGRNMSALCGQRIRLKFYMSNAVPYPFREKN